jgi:hypothetical protein
MMVMYSEPERTVKEVVVVYFKGLSWDLRKRHEALEHKISARITGVLEEI